MTDRKNHDRMANAIRALAMDAVEAAKSGHPGLPMGMADVATVLFTKFLKFDAADPKWPDRDRFVLSAGHGSMLLYALLYLTGYPEMTIEEIKRFRQLDSKTPATPKMSSRSGVETTTGPLGQGIANAVGMALAERIMNAEFGDDCRRSLYLCDRVRRRPDGRHQPGSDLARRAPQALEADRAVRRQPHHHRRRAVAFGLDRSGRALSGGELERGPHRRPRPRSDFESASKPRKNPTSRR